MRKLKIAALTVAVAMLSLMTHGQDVRVQVPLMLPASDTARQSFVRLINISSEAGNVRIFATDDGGNAADPITIRMAGNSATHFNSGDLTDGNVSKGLNEGIGSPRQGNWRLRVESALPVIVLSYVRTGDGFLTAMHDTVPRGSDGPLARMFNPGSNRNQRSSLRLINVGTSAERVSIVGFDDEGEQAGPVTLTLPAGHARTVSAVELEEGGRNLDGMLGDGAGKWELYVEASTSVVGVNLMETPTGHITNLSTSGFVAAALESEEDDQGNGIGRGNDCEDPDHRGQFHGAIALAPDTRGQDVPLTGGISWCRGSEAEAREAALRECGHSTCTVPVTFRGPSSSFTLWQCGAAVQGHSLITGRVEALAWGGEDLAAARDRALSECRGISSGDCELWEGMEACADGSHTGSNGPSGTRFQ